MDAHSLVNLAFNSTPTLGINTLKISVEFVLNRDPTTTESVQVIIGE